MKARTIFGTKNHSKSLFYFCKSLPSAGSRDTWTQTSKSKHRTSQDLVVFLTGVKNLNLTSFLIRTFLKYEIGRLPSDDVVGCQYAMTLSFFQDLPKPSSMYRLAMSRYKVTKNHFSMLIFCQTMYFFKRLCQRLISLESFPYLKKNINKISPPSCIQ